MTRVFQEFFHVNHVITKGGFRFSFGHFDRAYQLFFATYHAHTAATTTTGGFDDNRVTDAFSNGFVSLCIVADSTIRARYTRHTGFFHCFNGGNFITHKADRLRMRADKNQAAFLYLLGKVSALR